MQGYRQYIGEIVTVGGSRIDFIALFLPVAIG